jgi:hypothetical protein
MSAANDSQAPGYDAAYTEFDSPLMRRLRAEAYGEDIGQHSWVTAEELRGDSARLHLSPASRRAVRSRFSWLPPGAPAPASSRARPRSRRGALVPRRLEWNIGSRWSRPI